MDKYKKIKFLILLLGIGFLMGCEEKVESPDACYKLIISRGGQIIELNKPYVVEAGNEILFENCGYADFYSFFPGVDGLNYDDFINPGDSLTYGLDVGSEGDLSYTYNEPGNFKAVMLLTNRDPQNPKDAKQATIEFEIEVSPVEED